MNYEVIKSQANNNPQHMHLIIKGAMNAKLINFETYHSLTNEVISDTGVSREDLINPDNIDGYIIPHENLSHLQHKLEAMNKRAIKKGLEPIKIEVMCSYMDGVLSERTNTMIKTMKCVVKPTTDHVQQYDGYELVASIDNMDGGAVLNMSPVTNTELPEVIKLIARHAPNLCQHCGHDRQRKATYIVFNKDDNQFMQVGSTCLKDFINGKSAADIIWSHSFVSSVVSMLEEEVSYRASKPYFSTEELTYISACAIELFGFTSKSKAQQYGKFPTSQRVLNQIFPPMRKDNEWNELSNLIKEKREDLIKASQDAINWASNLEDSDSDYLMNLRTIFRSNGSDLKHIGYVCSVHSAYKRAMGEQQAKAAPKKELEFIAKEGDKLSYNPGKPTKADIKNGYNMVPAMLVTVKSFDYDEDWGNYSISIEQDGNKGYVTRSSVTDKSGNRLEEGGIYLMQAVVKANRTSRNGAKYTTFTRSQFIRMG